MSNQNLISPLLDSSQVLRIFINEIEKQLKKSSDSVTGDAKLAAASLDCKKDPNLLQYTQ